ncbi:hypothetical protein AMS68_002030 [Peltaster fructicola]|uniref:Uncharacterized protein n=1 Tax=Peltaster fructicola TaxID=286661 RepID=A0A6H0XP69_9PEZI|nr:hypothetical protein AMS68_002030 [Peltaster fructicola]
MWSQPSVLVLFALSCTVARNLAAQGRDDHNVCSATELVETDVGELIFAQPIIVDTSIATTGPFTVCEGLTLTISKAPTSIETTYTLYETQTVTDVHTITISDNVMVTETCVSPTPGVLTSSLVPTQPALTCGLPGNYYYGGSVITTLSLAGSGGTPQTTITASPLASTAGVVVIITSTLTVEYTGGSATSLTLLSACPTSGSNDGLLIIETPGVSVSSGAASSPSQVANAYYYYGGTVVTTLLLPATGNGPATMLVATPASTVTGATAQITRTIEVAAQGTEAGTLTVFSGYPTVGSDPALLVVETLAPAASNYYYYGGSVTTTIIVTGHDGSAASTIIGAPIISSTDVTVSLTATVSAGYPGSSTTSLTFFTASPTSGVDPGFLVVQTPTIGSIVPTLSSLLPTSRPALDSAFYYFGGTVVTTIVVPASGTQAARTITATPAASSGVLVSGITTISVPYNGIATTTITLFSSSPTPGNAQGTIVVETPTAATQTTPAGTGLVSVPAESSYFYFGGATKTTLTIPAAGGSTSVVTADPASSSGVTVNFVSTVTIPYNGASYTTITLFTASPTPGVDNGVLIIETPSQVISPAVTSGFYYIGGSTVTTLTTVGSDGTSTLVIASPASTSGVAVEITSTITIGYSGSDSTTITLFPTAPTPGVNNGVEVIETPLGSSGGTSAPGRGASSATNPPLLPTVSASTTRRIFTATDGAFYIGGTTLYTITYVGTDGSSTAVEATPFPTTGSAVVSYLTITEPYDGTATTTITLIATTPVSNTYIGSVIIETPAQTAATTTSGQASSPAASFYIGGSTVTTLTVSNPTGGDSFITASPALFTSGVTAVFETTISVGYSGVVVTSVTLFSASPTIGANPGTLIVETPSTNPPLTTTNGPSTTPFYIGGSSITTLTLTNTNGLSSLVTALPVTSTDGITIIPLSTITIGYSGVTETIVTLLPTSPIAGTNQATLVVETPLPTGAPSTNIASLTESSSNAYYIGGPTVTTLTITLATGGTSILTALPVATPDGITPAYISTITAGYNGASRTTITVFSASPTAGTVPATLVIETPTTLGPLAGTSSSGDTASQSYFYIGGTTSTILALTLSGAVSTITAAPADASGVTVNPVGTLTGPYAGSSVSSIQIFTTSPTAGSDDAFIVVQTPSATNTQVSSASSTLQSTTPSISSSIGGSIPPVSLSSILDLSSVAAESFPFSTGFVTSIPLPSISLPIDSSVGSSSPSPALGASATGFVTSIPLPSISLPIGSSVGSSSPSSALGSSAIDSFFSGAPATALSSGISLLSSATPTLLTLPTTSTASPFSLSAQNAARTSSFFYIGSTTTVIALVPTGSTDPTVVTGIPVQTTEAVVTVVTTSTISNAVSTGDPITAFPTSQTSGTITATVIIRQTTILVTSTTTPTSPGSLNTTPTFIGSSVSVTQPSSSLIPDTLPGVSSSSISIPVGSSVAPSSLLVITGSASATSLTVSLSSTSGLTLTIPIPSGGAPFVTTITNSNGDTVLVGVPTGTFVPSTSTGTVLPGALPFTTTIINNGSTEVVIGLTPSSVPASALPTSLLPQSVTSVPGGSSAVSDTSVVTGSPTIPISASAINPGVSSASVASTASASCAPLPTTSCAAAQIATSTQSVIDAINNVTTASQNLQSSANGIDNTPAGVLAAGQVGSGLSNIASTLGNDLQLLSSVNAFNTECDQVAVVVALTKFVQVHQALLSIVIGKSGVISNVPGAGPPVAAGIRAVEGAVDALAFKLISLISSPAENCQAAAQKSSIDTTLQQADAAYASANQVSSASSGTGTTSATATGTCGPLPTSSCAAAQIGSSAQSLIDAINAVTTQSQNLQAPANSIDTSLTGLAAASQVAQGFTSIITALSNDAQLLPTLQPLDVECDQLAVVTALTKFVQVHQALLNIVIGKAGLISQVPAAGPPIATTIRGLESIVDTIALQIIALLPSPTESCQAKAQQAAIDATLAQAVGAYSNSSPSSSLASLSTTPSSSSPTSLSTVPSSSTASLAPSGTCGPLPTASCAAAQIASSAQSVIDAINAVTTASQNLESSANAVDTSLTGIAAAAQVAQGLNTIVSSLTTDLNTLASLQPFDAECDQVAIVTALTKFVQVHQALLNIVIGKAGLIASVPGAGPPVAAAIRAIETIVDSVAFRLIALIPSPTENCATNVQKNAIDGTLQQAVAAYSSSPVTATTSAGAAAGTCAPLPTASCAAAQIAGSAQTIINAINQVTTLSQDLQGSANNIDLSVTGLAAAASVAAGFTNIVTTITSDITALAAIQPLDAACDQLAVVTALTKFVQVHQALLNIVIGKSGLIATVPLAGPPIAAAIRALEGVVDTIAFRIIGLLGSADAKCAASAQQSAIDGTLSQATTAYPATGASSTTSAATTTATATGCPALPSCPAAQVASSAQTVINAINAVTTASQNLISSANNLGTSFTGLAAAASLVTGFGQIVTAVTQDITTLGQINPFDAECDQAAIVIALTKFVQVHQALLNIVIGKAGLISAIPAAGPPIAAAIRALEGVVDTIAFRLIALVPGASCQATAQKNALDFTFGEAIASYPSTISL